MNCRLPKSFYKLAFLGTLACLGLNACESMDMSEKPSACFYISEPEVDDGKFVVDEKLNFLNCSAFADQWNWDFGDGTTAQGMEVSHTFTKAGEYVVELTAWSTTDKTTGIVSRKIHVMAAPLAK